MLTFLTITQLYGALAVALGLIGAGVAWAVRGRVRQMVRRCSTPMPHRQPSMRSPA